MSDTPMLSVRNLTKYFPVRRGFLFSRVQTWLQAVDNVSFDITRGETLGLVGESGCGKTTVARTIIRLYEPTSGECELDGVDLFGLSTDELLRFRRRVQMIFQDPYASLNPRMTVSEIIGEAIDIHRLAVTERDRRSRIHQLLELVGLSREHASRYPHEFSGGQRQRIGIARSLAVDPDVLLLDEPISALDVSIQAQIVNLLEDLQDELNLTYLLIAHDLAMVRHISDRVAVMYLGKIVEVAPGLSLYRKPLHPYSIALLSAIPIPDPDLEARRQRLILEGDVPSPLKPPSGCRFRTRCPEAGPICAESEPEMRVMGEDHEVACHMVD